MKTRGIPASLPSLACSLLFALSVLPLARAGDNAPARKATPPDDDLTRRLGHLTLDDAIDIALHRNPNILVQLQEIQRTQGVVIQVRGLALPQIIASGTYTQTDPRLSSGTGGTGTSFSNGTTTTTTGGTTGGGTGTGTTIKDLSLPTVVNGTNQAGPLLPLSDLFGSGRNGSTLDKSYVVQVQVQQAVYNAAIPPQIRAAKFLRDSSYYSLRETVDTVVNTVKTDFYTVLVDKRLIDIQNENLRLLQSQLTDQQNRFNAGTVPRFDVLQASVAVANQRPQVITATNNLGLSYISLARTLGLEYGPDQAAHSPINPVGELEYKPQNFDPQSGVNAGKANRALLKSQQLTILSNIQQVKVAAAGYQPNVTASAGYELTNDRLNDDLGHTLNGWFFGGQFNWSIFDGLQTYGRVKQAVSTLRASRITYLDLVNQVVQDIQNNFLTLQQSKELIASQVLNVEEAREAVRLAQARLSAGAGTQLDVLQSQTQLLTAQTTELQARYNYAVALSNYERVTATSTVYDEAFYDPLTNRRQPFGRDASGAPVAGPQLPAGTLKTPDVSVRGTGKPLPKKINAENPKRDARPSKPIRQREYLLEE